MTKPVISAEQNKKKIKKFNFDFNPYGLDYVNCIEKALGIGLERVGGAGYRKLFHLYLKMFQSYKIQKFTDDSILYPIDIHPYIHWIFNNKLNLEISIFKPDISEIGEKIFELVDRRQPVFITGNLKELFYSEHFQQSNARHLFLINGYEKQAHLYNVINGVHNRWDDNRYQEFVIPFDILESMYESYDENIDEAFLCVIKKQEDLEVKEVLKGCLKLLPMRCNQPFWESDYIEQIHRVIRGDIEVNICGKGIDFIFIRTIKYKELFYALMSECIEELFPDKIPIEEIAHLANRLKQEWGGILDISMMGLYLKREFDIEAKLREVNKVEMGMLDCISNL